MPSKGIIIDSSENGIVIKETKVQLSDEKLKSLLLKAYEKAQEDSNSKAYYDYCSILLSIAGTLFVSLLTSTFGEILKVPSAIVTAIAWILCILCGIVGFIFLGIKVSVKTKTDTKKRDDAIQEIFDEHLVQ